MTWTLWHRPLMDLREKSARLAHVSDDLTERYLKNWLAEEPDSPHAQKLYQAFLESRQPE